jgi:hypothetical protein
VLKYEMFICHERKGKVRKQDVAMLRSLGYHRSGDEGRYSFKK